MSSPRNDSAESNKAPDVDLEDGVAQIEDAHPQIPATEPDEIPKIEHQDATPSKTEKNYPGGERFDPSALPQSDDTKEILKQVEFYFSDSNLATDKFLYTMISENAGWADLRTVANFKRMRRFQPFTSVVAALRESTFLEVDDSGEKVKRKTELKPFTATNSPVSRSVYVKGFPEETKTLQVDLEKYFEGFGDIKVVRLRRTDDGKFKGSVFVEFASGDQQEAYLKLFDTEEKPKYEEKELEGMSKKAYLDMKEKQYGGKFPTNSGKKGFNAFAKDTNKGRGGRGRGRGRGRGGYEGRSNNNDRNGEKQATTSQGQKRAYEDNATKSENANKVQKVAEETSA